MPRPAFATAASRMRALLVWMETEFGYLKRGGSETNPYWILDLATRTRLSGLPAREETGKPDWESAKSRILEIMRERAGRGEPPLANASVREITLLDRQQVNRLIHELADDGHLRIEGHGWGARYVYAGPLEPRR